jgi:biotin transport system substrate-specific component
MQMIATTSPSRTASFSTFADTVPGKLLLGLAATGVVAAAAHVAIPLPFTPVPLTLQPLAVLGVGLALGPVAGFLTMLAYLAEGAAGIPVFSPTGPGGLAQLFGTSGGYLMAYPLVAFLAGIARRLSDRVPRFLSATISSGLAVIVLFVLGAGWLMRLAHLSLHQTWIAGVAPFLPGEIVKVFVAAGIYSALYRSKRIV